MKEYIFVPYDARYVAQFRREKAKIMKMLPYAVTVEHFGSTAVKGLKGKGVLDIYVLVHKTMFEDAQESLSAHGYENFGVKELEGGLKVVLRKSYRYKQKLRTVNIHIGTVGIADFATVLSFRDKLRSSKKLCREYEQVKKRAVSMMNNDGEFNDINTRNYVTAKSSFIRQYS